MAQGVVSIFSYVRRLGPFLGFKILNFYIFGFYQKNEKNGYEETVDISGGHYKIRLFWGFISIHFKVKVQNGNIFWGSQNLKCFLGYA